MSVSVIICTIRIPWSMEPCILCSCLSTHLPSKKMGTNRALTFGACEKQFGGSDSPILALSVPSWQMSSQWLVLQSNDLGAQHLMWTLSFLHDPGGVNLRCSLGCELVPDWQANFSRILGQKCSWRGWDHNRQPSHPVSGHEFITESSTKEKGLSAACSHVPSVFSLNQVYWISSSLLFIAVFFPSLNLSPVQCCRSFVKLCCFVGSLSLSLYALSLGFSISLTLYLHLLRLSLHVLKLHPYIFWPMPTFECMCIVIHLYTSM